MKPADRKGNGTRKDNNPRKIREIRVSVESGKYRVDSSKVAERIIRQALQEIRGRTR